MMTHWMPIESAPRDGTPVILYIPECKDDGLPAFVVEGWYESGVFDRRWYEAARGGICRPAPTYWMPLPAPPQHEV